MDMLAIGLAVALLASFAYTKRRVDTLSRKHDLVVKQLVAENATLRQHNEAKRTQITTITNALEMLRVENASMRKRENLYAELAEGDQRYTEAVSPVINGQGFQDTVLLTGFAPTEPLQQ